MKINKIYIASDHAGFDLKERVKDFLKSKFEVIDLGTNSSDVSVDYPDFAHELALRLKDDDYGILICGTGIGISIAANRHENIRCALCHDHLGAKLSREHNNANVIAFGARVVGDEVAYDMLNTFFSTEFAGQRHEKRVIKINYKESR
ncbi:allose-6-phosphate isomerase / ribose-5-phosphate isomerase B [Campylobacter pinnipediorum subsp. caledonicus]|uniref:Allose-6-phosphate isomerase / ribose-5-phosphate isomerase B n=1 Tax=Campylobacter pinnipediorum subsp. caledonicus TaxID=1874362 RepID=A0A1S6U8S0_9BACT|nr:ribose 5-phosphate isomerase B [Campylobacter pinnipediorum]AQW86484.1 allose-6-phosphate isomerase / ribose-5-phosphate isomerase B [Campylobacter pinnipediorum subsp. caledonicus]AQW88136.1 allose-6-phosphate isomerase / ribose-5-phosphate isomerase B [Campylobacter pinnipediorum subsp. caledonicus]OPA71576.1 ribose 5-phosphate isomerase B [Campylobacter pinnipediorum subsp. caledonicus]